MSNEPNPQEALDAIRAARAEVGKSANYPFIWDLGYGAIIALMVGGAALPQPWNLMSLGLSMAGLALMVRWWRDHIGWWVSGFHPPKARWVAIGMAAVLVACLIASLSTRFGQGAWWVPLVASGVAGLAGIIGGRLWMRVYRKELQGGGQ